MQYKKTKFFVYIVSLLAIVLTLLFTFRGLLA